MSTNPAKGPAHSKRSKRWPHIEFAEQIMALVRRDLPESEREAVEKHFQECIACFGAYKALCEVAELVPDEPAPERSPDLPAKLLALQAKLLAEDQQVADAPVRSAAPRRLPANRRTLPGAPRQTLRSVANGNQPQKKTAAAKAKRRGMPPAEAAPDEESATIRPVVAKCP